jgi:SAM-dependent methyltransferase
VTYRPREFWEQRLSEQFDLRGTGETGLSLAYNRACYTLRREVLDRALADAGFEPRGRRVLDVGCGTGFWTEYYLRRGAEVTGIDIAPTAIARLGERFPQARFVLADVGEAPIEGRYDVVNAFDVLYHITDDARWTAALTHLARAVADGGLLLVTDTFAESGALAEHNRMRPLTAYTRVLEAEGLTRIGLRATHVLLNRELHAFRFLNRAPGVLLAVDRALLAAGLGRGADTNTLLVARRTR